MTYNGKSSLVESRRRVNRVRLPSETRRKVSHVGTTFVSFEFYLDEKIALEFPRQETRRENVASSVIELSGIPSPSNLKLVRCS